MRRCLFLLVPQSVAERAEENLVGLARQVTVSSEYLVTSGCGVWGRWKSESYVKEARRRGSSVGGLVYG
jgi:hypothetical protein